MLIMKRLSLALFATFGLVIGPMATACDDDVEEVHVEESSGDEDVEEAVDEAEDEVDEEF